ncbi:MAG: Mur ligase domain-containing protein, partial [Candidatus Omnitrophica bacterium]|nr:Mur ligase domain-containing protein [Candidatus Omnitrophota bacterium]
MFTLDELTEASGGYFSGGVSNGRVKGISIDSRTLKPGDAFIAVKGDNFDGHDFVGQAIKRGAKAVIVTSHKSQVTSHKLPVIKVKDTTKALGDIARFHRRRFDIPVIAVTGSNGKTTTKDMAAHVLSNNFKVLKNEGTK